ncbi:MAG: helix-hairpin-helix domain-containing protein [Candidatus Thorarchaeota archaeon]
MTVKGKKKKTTKKKEETVQTTLGELLETPKKKQSKKAKSTRAKSTSKKAKAAKTPAKKSEIKSKTSKGTKTRAKKKQSKKKKTRGKKAPVKIEQATIDELTKIPTVGQKLAEKLAAAKYDSIEKIARARASSISKKVVGVSESGAKNLIDLAKATLKSASAPEDAGDELDDESTDRLSLSDVPGVGSKLALSLAKAGYDTPARLSRARPESLARGVAGLNVASATKLVNAAKSMMKAREMERIIGETSPVVVSTKTAKKPKKEASPKKAAPKEKTPVSKPKKAPKKKTKSPTLPAKHRKKALPPPKRKKHKVIRKDSGLPVPEAVQKLAVEMKQTWAEAAKRAKRKKTPEEIEMQVETVEVVSLTADDTTERIIDTAIEILNETMTSGRPAFEIPSRSGDNIVWDEVRDLLLLGMRTISRPYHSLASVVDATRTARVMEIVFNLLKSNLHATKREVFYSDVNLFRDQKYSDKIIEDVASMIQTTRDSIHVVASARGSAMGRVVIRDGGDLIDLTKMGTGGWAVTPFLDQLEIVESDAEFIILSEKDAAVMRLAEAKYWNRQPCIVLTGKGSGDIATRAFLKMLVKELEIPAFALVDSDPYGHYIYSVFLRGSKRLSYESPFIATPELKLLGVLSRDLDEYKIPKAVRIPMQPTDIKRVKDMLKEPFVRRNKPWVEDLQLMLKLKEKAEIQAFASHSFKYLTDDYLPRKLETGDWI